MSSFQLISRLFCLHSMGIWTLQASVGQAVCAYSTGQGQDVLLSHAEFMPQDFRQRTIVGKIRRLHQKCQSPEMRLQMAQILFQHTWKTESCTDWGQTTSHLTSHAQSRIKMSDFGLYSLENVPRKGKGLLAKSDIWRGTQIIDEPALFTTESLQDPNNIESDLRTIVKSLSRDDQRRFLSLHNNNPGPNPFSNIIRSNGYPCGPSSDIGGIFCETARIK